MTVVVSTDQTSDVTVVNIDVKRSQRTKNIKNVRDVTSINKKYVLWNMYLPNAVAFHTPVSKYLIEL